MSLLAVNGFALGTGEMTDSWFEESPSAGEISNWMNNLASKFGKTYPNVTRDTAKPLELAALRKLARLGVERLEAAALPKDLLEPIEDVLFARTPDATEVLTRIA